MYNHSTPGDFYDDGPAYVRPWGENSEVNSGALVAPVAGQQLVTMPVVQYKGHYLLLGTLTADPLGALFTNLQLLVNKKPMLRAPAPLDSTAATGSSRLTSYNGNLAIWLELSTGDVLSIAVVASDLTATYHADNITLQRYRFGGCHCGCGGDR